jgi:hypothetical protein
MEFINSSTLYTVRLLSVYPKYYIPSTLDQLIGEQQEVSPTRRIPFLKISMNREFRLGCGMGTYP